MAEIISNMSDQNLEGVYALKTQEHHQKIDARRTHWLWLTLCDP